MYQALPAEGHQVGLGVAPAPERPGPLGGSPQIEHLLAGVDRPAEHEPGDDWRNLARGDDDHGLVEP